MSLDVFHLSHACSLLIKPHYSRRHQCASIYQYVQVDGGVKHKSLNAVYNSSRYCHCVEEPLMQSKSSTTAEEQLSSSRHCSNQQGWVMQLIGVRQVFEQPVKADRNNWNWPFLVHQMLLMRPGVQTHSDVVDFSWAVLKLCWMFSCKKTSNPRNRNYRIPTLWIKLKHARNTVDYVHYFATPSTGYEMIPPRHEKLWTASLRRKSGRCPTRKCPWHQTIAMQQTCEWCN